MNDYSVYSRSYDGDKLLELLVRAPEAFERVDHVRDDSGTQKTKKTGFVFDALGSVPSNPCSPASGGTPLAGQLSAGDPASSLTGAGGEFGGGGASGRFESLSEVLSIFDIF